MIEEINYSKYIENKEEYERLVKEYNNRILLSGSKVSESGYDWKHELIKFLLQKDNYKCLLIHPEINNIHGVNGVGKFAWEISLIDKCSIYCMWIDNLISRERLLEMGVIISTYKNCRYIIGMAPTTSDNLDFQKKLYLMNNLKLINDFRMVDSVEFMCKEIINNDY